MSSYSTCPTILFSACWDNQTKIMKECIRNGYEINNLNFRFQSPLILASKTNNLDAVKILVENGADLNIIDIYGSTALGYAKDKSEVQQYLTSKGAKCLKWSKESMSNLKIEIGNYDPVSSTTKEIINKIDSWGFSPFMWAIRHRSENHFKHYLALGANVNQKCRNGTTPLMLACFWGNLNMVKELIEKGALINDIDDNGNSALMYLTSWTVFESEIADLLIQKGAEINQNEINSLNPLILATIFDNLTALKYFLNKKANVNATDDTGNTALAYASYHGQIDTAKILIKNKANLNLCGPKGKTPLSWAATTNNLKMVDLLLSNGAEINQKDYYNYTALAYAKQYCHSEIIKYLKNKAQETNPLSSSGADNTGENNSLMTTTLCLAIQQNNFELVKSLIEKGDEDPCELDSNGNTPIMTATRAKNQKIVKYLLENGADWTVHSALPIAIEENDLEIAKILLENGAKVNKYYSKQTPLMQAINLKNIKMVQFLVENGADPNLNGIPLQMAVQLKNRNIAKYLIEKGADVNSACENQQTLLKLAIEQENFSLVVFLIKNGANVKNYIYDLEELSKKNGDFLEFFNEKIASQYKANKLETNEN